VLAVALLPLTLYKMGWLAFSKPTVGTVLYIAQTNSRTTGRQTYPVVEYNTGRHKLTASGDYNLPYSAGDPYPIRYNQFNETDTRLNTFWGCWIDTMIWNTIFTVIISITFLVDGIVPKESLINLSLKGIKFTEKGIGH